MGLFDRARDLLRSPADRRLIAEAREAWGSAPAPMPAAEVAARMDGVARVRYEDFLKDPDRVFRMSEEDGSVLLVNDDGSVGATISTPTDDREPCAY